MAVRKLDRDVRIHLHEYLKREVAAAPDAVIIDELTLQRKDGRIDVAVASKHLHGYEIKSEADKLDRLKRQVRVYSKVFDYLSVVVDDRHLADVVHKIPEYWGVYVWFPDRGVGIIRVPQLNADVKKTALTQLLWKENALQMLRDVGSSKGTSNMPKWRLWSKVEEACTHAAIHTAVLNQMKNHRRLEQVG